MDHRNAQAAPSAMPPTIVDIRNAAERIKDVLIETPLLESDRLNACLGGRLLVKADGLQRTGSFKARGAWNRLSQLSDAERARGVVAFSSGNHGQAVPWAARLLGIRSVLVAMPHDTPATKVDKARGYGAEILFFDRATTDRAALIAELIAERGMIFVPPYDDPRVIAGAGTLGLEAARQARAMGATPDAMLVCSGGGGLTAGCVLAWEAEWPDARVIAVEPEGFDDLARSITAGRRVANERAGGSICDAILTPMPGVLPFDVMRRRIGGAVTVTDKEALAAMRIAMIDFGVVAEPGGAVALAAALFGRIEIKGRTVVAAITGSNADTDVLAMALRTPVPF